MPDDQHRSSSASPATITRRAVLGGLAISAMGLAAGPSVASAASARRRDVPSLILVNGRIFTLGSTPVEAIAVRRGVVQQIGSTREIQTMAGKNTQVIDLAGRTALPGINDSHVHGLAAGASLPPLSLDVSYPTVTSIADIVAAVAAAVQQQPAGSWIRGSGWNTALLAETRADPSRLPNRADLDAVSPNNPVALRDFSFHTVWANSKAMELAGITRDTPAPPGGVIDRDASGDPIGLFRENAQPLILAAMPALSVAELSSGLQRAISILLSQGITSYTDPGLTSSELAIYRSALADDALRSRVTLMLSSSRSLQVGGTGGGSVDLLDDLLAEYPKPQVFARHLLALRGVKIFADGIPPNHTAWVYEPYVDQGGHGDLVVAGDTDDDRVAQINAIVARAHAAGFQVGTHATGDHTLDVVVDAYLAALAATPRFGDPRHYTIHSDLITDAALGKLAGNRLGANMNPSIKAAIADAMVGVLGSTRAHRQWPTRSALRAGVNLTSASDWPVGPPDWRAGVVNAVLRKDQLSGTISGAKERIGVLDAVHSYTTGAAYQDGAEQWKGRLLPGMAADVCILDGTLPTTRDEVEALLDVPVAATVFNGDVVYERSSSAGSVSNKTGAAGAACGHGVTCCCTRAPDLLAGHG